MSFKSKKTDSKIVWLDMEMTGLDPETCHILEIACIVTDKDLQPVSSLFHVVVNQPLHVLQEMNSWCRQHHFMSGLVQDCKKSTTDIKSAENMLLEFLKKYTPPGGCPLAGNTVYMDKLFINKHLPKIADHLHYRLIDVTSITELCRRWYPEFNSIKKSQNHRAKTDVQESIKELKLLRKMVFTSALKNVPLFL